ncbi:MAG: DNA repair protein RecO [Clostridiales bacterium]|jgi:DNA repair protein RecO (recombination protein O)|nr:DNA repair protein RecO [Clostridiales bacterium]
MRIVRTQGIVLRYTNFREADRMLTIFSPDRGKMQVLARGCRKPKSRLLAASELFCYADYIFVKSKEIYVMTQADIRNSFYDIRNDVERLTYGTHILALTEEAVNYEEGNFRLFYMLLQVLAYLAYGEINPADTAHVFELKLIDLLGYRPVLDRCIACGSPIEQLNSNKLFFSASQGGIVCRSCNSGVNDGYAVHKNTIQTMRFILSMDIKRLGVLKFSGMVRNELDYILSGYLSEIIGRPIKTRSFIDMIKNDK